MDFTPNLASGSAVLAAQPFSAWIGAELEGFEPGRAVLALNLRPELHQQHGFAHGGVLCYLADNALTFAGGSVLGPAVVTSELKVNYLRPAQGERLVAEATVLSSGRSQAVVRCDIHVLEGGSRKLCAAAQGTITLLTQPAPQA
ncbi:PaaI family thioesterase [Thiomonas intermedia]|uniref:PaaI family thioesterase n=1 Tax=Thiomonas intermedia TaxID=926 RepID=UPI0009A4EFFE|nr:PaaI family thioesterase [Thiomonas intermedia]